MTIAELKRALVEVSNMCARTEECGSAKRCPFWCEVANGCSLDHHFPEYWDVDDWKEDGK